MTAFVASVKVLLYCPGSFSLKNKRQFIRSITDRLKEKLNVSVAEVAHQDHQRLIGLGLAFVSSNRRQLDRIISRVENEIDGTRGIQIREFNKQIF